MLLVFVMFGTSFFAQSQSDMAFEKTKGSWYMPIPAYVEIQDNKYRMRERLYNGQDSTWRFIANTSYDVKAVAKGIVIGKFKIEDGETLVMQSGNYVVMYSNLTNTNVEKGNVIAAGHVLGKMRELVDGSIYIDLSLYKGQMMLDPKSWFKR